MDHTLFMRSILVWYLYIGRGRLRHVCSWFPDSKRDFGFGYVSKADCDVLDLGEKAVVCLRCIKSKVEVK